MKQEIIRCDDTYFASSELELSWDVNRPLKCCYLKVQPQMGDKQTVILRPEEIDELIEKLQKVKEELCNKK